MEPTFRSTDPAPASPFHRGVGAILRSDDRVLLALRSAKRDWAPDTWDVPGGHVEQSETEVDAVIREMREELGTEIRPGRTAVSTRGAELRHRLIRHRHVVWHADELGAGRARRHQDEHVAIRWWSSIELADLALADDKLLPILLSALA
jgi:8-oxo-dGTP diphosphatase